MEKVRLGDLLLYEQPTKYLVESDMYDDSYEVPVLTAGKSFLLGYTDEKENIFENVPVIIFDDFTTSTQFVDFPFKVKSSAMKILNCNNEKADIRYMFYLLQTIKIDSERHKRYWISQFAKMDILLPSLSVQQAIAAQLDQARELVQYHHQLLEKYDELQQSLFLEMFGDPVLNEKGWERKSLKKVCNKIGSGSTPRGGKSSYKTEGISLIRSMNVYDNEFLYTDLAFIDDEQASRLNNVIVEENDVLFNITGASVCRSTIVPNNVLPARVNQHVSIIRAKKEMLNSIFLNRLLISEAVKRSLLKIGSGGGAVMQAITKLQLEQFEIILPPLSLQSEFASYIESIEYQKSLVREALQQSEDVFNGLLQESFG